MLKHTPFHDFHLSAKARLVDYAGWEMPLFFAGITQEHVQTRTSGSIFDVSHMGRLRFSGKGATPFLQRVLTRDLSKQVEGTSRYSLVCNERGGVMDDVIVSRDQSDWMVVCNASNRPKLLDHFVGVAREGGFDVVINDTTEKTAMVAVQGPAVMDRLANVLPFEVKQLKRYSFETAEAMFVKFTVFRSGYTGEDGVEIILPARAASMAMKFLAGGLKKAEATIKPAGLGARDTLRLEAGMPLYGHELTESVDPISAGLAWAVDLEKDFIGVAALRDIAAKGAARQLVGLELQGRRIARQGYEVIQQGACVGEVTSGTLSPTLQKSIAMAYVDAPLAKAGTELDVNLKGAQEKARVVPLPFYKRSV